MTESEEKKLRAKMVRAFLDAITAVDMPASARRELKDLVKTMRWLE